MENDPLAKLLEQIIPDSVDKRGIIKDSLKVIGELANRAAEMIASEPGLLDLYILLAKRKQYPLLVRGGLPTRDPLRLIDLANQAALILVKHGLYDEIVGLSNAASNNLFLLYDAARLYMLNRLSELENLAKRHKVAPWILSYIAAMTAAALARGLASLLEARKIHLEPLNNECPVCGINLARGKCPLCGREWS